jgi:hypothetical protein
MKNGIFISLFMLFSSFAFSQNALYFDGNVSYNYVDCGNDATLDITGPITIEAWINVDASSFLGWRRIIEKNWATSYFLGSGDGTNNFSIAFSMDANNNVSNVLQTGSNVIAPNVWNHVAGIWDESDLYIYVNGILEATMPWSNTADGDGISTQIGRYIGGGSYHFRGNIDEVRIWNVARTPAQLQQNMHRELINPTSEINLVAYYQFNETGGTNLPDVSANTNNGTLINMDPLNDWVVSTAPIPYYTVADGSWNNDATWAVGQNAPTLDWAMAAINNDIIVDSDETAQDVTINPSGQLTVAATTSAFNVLNQFTIKSDATGTGSFIDLGAFTTGNSTVERYYEFDEWHLVSSPLTNGEAGIYTGMYLQSYNETSGSWNDIIPVDEPLNIMQGYALWIQIGSTYTADYSGTLTTGNQSIGFTANNPFGWNLFGNPYPSAIDWNLVIPVTGMNSSIYYLDAASGNYLAYNGIVGASRYIPPMQGFWVSATSGGSLALDNTMRTHSGKDTYFKEDIQDFVVLKASGNDFDDKMYVYFDDNATASFDSDADAYKLISAYNDLLPQLYSFSDDVKLSIDARPSTESINLGFLSHTSGMYSISLEENNNFTSLILEDLLTGLFIDLTQNDYDFTYNTSDIESRFVLHFSATGIEDNSLLTEHIYSYEDRIYVNIDMSNNANAYVYNMLGQVVYQQKIEQGLNSIKINYSGNYIVRVVSDHRICTKKVFIKSI